MNVNVRINTACGSTPLHMMRWSKVLASVTSGSQLEVLITDGETSTRLRETYGNQREEGVR